MKLSATLLESGEQPSRKNFFVFLKERGLKGMQLIIGDKALGMLEAIAEVFPQVCYQRCTVHFYATYLL